jgi:hypothetical protein
LANQLSTRTPISSPVAAARSRVPGQLGDVDQQQDLTDARSTQDEVRAPLEQQSAGLDVLHADRPDR